jgi:hypothetical protein
MLLTLSAVDGMPMIERIGVVAAGIFTMKWMET